MTGSRIKRWATKRRVVFLVLLAVASLGVGLHAFAANAPAPTIVSGPANPTNQTAATFTYTDTGSPTSYQCRLDTAAFATCGTTKTSARSYSGLAAGSHTFQVRAVFPSQTSGATSYTWTIDTTPPFVSGIARSGASPTNAASVSWTVTFTEPVTGVDISDFQLVSSGIVAPLVTSVSGSGSSYSVSASTGLGSMGTLRLNLVDNDSIHDPAGNPLGGAGLGNGSFTGAAYGIDRVPPPAPQFTQTPPDPSPTAAATFAWTDSEASVSYRCSIDGGASFSCTSPYSYTATPSSNGANHFSVVAIDGVGNASAATTYAWKISPVNFSIGGNPDGLLYPGVWRSLLVTITNPNSYTITVTQVSVQASTSPAGCAASSNLSFQQSPISSSHTDTVPPHSTVSLSAGDRPRIELIDLPTNQDACKNGHFGLQYSGLATH